MVVSEKATSRILGSFFQMDQEMGRPEAILPLLFQEQRVSKGQHSHSLAGVCCRSSNGIQVQEVHLQTVYTDCCLPLCNGDCSRNVEMDKQDWICCHHIFRNE